MFYDDDDDDDDRLTKRQDMREMGAMTAESYLPLIVK